MNKNITVLKFNSTRLDIYLSEQLKFTRAAITKLIKANRVKVNGNLITKPGFEIKLNDTIEIIDDTKSIEQVLMPYVAPLDVKYEDDDLIIVYKPSNVLSHSTQYNEQDTMQNIILNYAKNKYIPLLVHRLDKQTSGLIVYAKNEHIQTQLKQLFEQRQITKKYYALVHGVPKFDHVMVNVPIARANDNKLKMVAGEGKVAKPALTEISIKTAYDKFSLLDINLHTGRTHQIRVHLKYLNTPVINDPLYGMEQEITPYGQYLMAYHISFNHPRTLQPVSVTIDLDQEFKDIIEKFK